tara:strand:+ start:976 stop:1101 length:126 start_codon:yes stop_codon:yes gene_type:complete
MLIGIRYLRMGKIRQIISKIIDRWVEKSWQRKANKLHGRIK